MDSKKIYLTKNGLVDLQKEHDELSKVKRPEVVTRVTDARNQGDLSENAEYVAAREELAFIDGRIDELEEMLKQVTLIEDTKTSSSAVDLGSEVTLKIDDTHEIYRVVGEWEADPAEKKISHESPLGKALMGKKVGESVEVQAPAGKIIYTVVSVK
ncbi:MAG: transcription elongation factor GreA [Candidatus Levybacteria bacterium]|nr:transcription elongation factor GreA [Candidatus Levybacteria bacterium]